MPLGQVLESGHTHPLQVSQGLAHNAAAASHPKWNSFRAYLALPLRQGLVYALLATVKAKQAGNQSLAAAALAANAKINRTRRQYAHLESLHRQICGRGAWCGAQAVVCGKYLLDERERVVCEGPVRVVGVDGAVKVVGGSEAGMEMYTAITPNAVLFFRHVEREDGKEGLERVLELPTSRLTLDPSTSSRRVSHLILKS